MPGKGYKSLGIREGIYDWLKEERYEGESFSDFIGRVLLIYEKEKERFGEKGNKFLFMPLSKEDLDKAMQGVGNNTFRPLAFIREGIEKKNKRIIGSFWGICKTCGYKIINTSPPDSDNEHNDYWWYCSNIDCEHHHPGEGTSDMDCPDWVESDAKK